METLTTVYLASAPTVSIKTRLAEGLEALRACGLDLGAGEIVCRKVPREDWSESWKKHFQPIEIGRRLLVKPSWSKRPAKKGQSVVILDPGLSFGTGQHPTTSFCLGELCRARIDSKNQSFLDMGTGSGILAIAAAKLGYSPVRAFDFDPAAVRIAQANARRNRVENRLRITRSDLTRLAHQGHSRSDVICANLMADLLIAERCKILARLKSDGRLILAGILSHQFPAVLQAYEAEGVRLVSRKAEGEWESAAFEAR